MTVLTTEVDTRRLEKALRIFPRRLKVYMGDAFDHISRKFLKQFFKERLAGPPGIKAWPHGLKKRFRRASIVSSTIDGMGMRIFTDSDIAHLHETGAVLSGSGGKKIPAPLSARTEIYTRAGRLRKRFRDVSRIPGLVRIKIKGQQYLVKKKRRSQEIKPLFVLKNRIRIKPRLGYYKTWDSMQNDRIRIINKGVEKALTEF